MMKIDELLEYFDNGGKFGDDPEIVSSMRAYIKENRRLLFEMNSVTHDIPPNVIAAGVPAKVIREI